MKKSEDYKVVIRNLDPETKEVDIIRLLDNFSSLKSVTVIPKYNKMSVCHVILGEYSDYVSIISMFNGSFFKEKMISVTPYMTSEEFEDASKRTLLAFGVDEELPLYSIQEEIEQYTTVSSLFPNFKHNGSFSGSVSVVLSSEEACNAFLESNKSMNINGKTVTFEKYSSNYKREVVLNLHIRNIPKTWDEATLTEYCAHFGEISSCILIQKNENFIHGFVCYADKASYDRALNCTEETNPEGLVFEVYQSHEERQRQRGEERRNAIKDKEIACKEHRVIFIRKIPGHYDKEFWEKRFKSCGEITSILINPDKNHEKKFTAQIIFKTTEGAKKALDILGRKEFISKGIYAAMASPRNEHVTSKPVHHEEKVKPPAISMSQLVFDLYDPYGWNPF